MEFFMKVLIISEYLFMIMTIIGILFLVFTDSLLVGIMMMVFSGVSHFWIRKTELEEVQF